MSHEPFAFAVLFLMTNNKLIPTQATPLVQKTPYIISNRSNLNLLLLSIQTPQRWSLHSSLCVRKRYRTFNNIMKCFKIGSCGK
jgi:hypothetical protein